MDKCFTAVVLSVLILSFAVTGYAQELDRETLLRHYQAPMFVQLSDQTYLLEDTDVEAKSHGAGRPSRVAWQLSGSFVGGAAAALVCWEILKEPDRDDNLMGGVGIVLGEVIGSTLSVYHIGTIGDFGSIGDEARLFLATLAGSALGAGVGLSAWVTTTGEWWWTLFLCPTVGATIGFNLTRMYDSPPAEYKTALINVRDGRMSLAVPRVYFRSDNFGRGSLSQSADLVRIRF